MKGKIIAAWVFLFLIAALIMTAVIGVLINLFYNMGLWSIVFTLGGVLLIWLGAWAIKTIENNKL